MNLEFCHCGAPATIAVADLVRFPHEAGYWRYVPARRRIGCAAHPPAPSRVMEESSEETAKARAIEHAHILAGIGR